MDYWLDLLHTFKGESRESILRGRELEVEVTSNSQSEVLRCITWSLAESKVERSPVDTLSPPEQ